MWATDVVARNAATGSIPWEEQAVIYVYVSSWLLFAVAAWALATVKGRAPGTAALLGLLLGPLGVLFMLFVESHPLADARGRGDWKECPFCAERIRVKAHVCRYCGRDLPGSSA